MGESKFVGLRSDLGKLIEESGIISNLECRVLDAAVCDDDEIPALLRDLIDESRRLTDRLMAMVHFPGACETKMVDSVVVVYSGVRELLADNGLEGDKSMRLFVAPECIADPCPDGELPIIGSRIIYIETNGDPILVAVQDSINDEAHLVDSFDQLLRESNEFDWVMGILFDAFGLEP